MGGMSSSPGSCKVLTNVITITNPFGTSGSYSKGSSALEFRVSGGGSNPYSVVDAGSFNIKTYATISGLDYDIDQGVITTVFTPTPALLVASV